MNKYFFLIFSNKYTVTVHTYTVSRGGGVWGKMRGGGLRQIKQLITTFGIAFYESNLSAGCTHTVREKLADNPYIFHAEETKLSPHRIEREGEPEN